MARRIEDGNPLRGLAADYRSAIDDLPYTDAEMTLSEGDEVADYRDGSDGDKVEYQRKVRTYKEDRRGHSPPDEVYYTLGESTIEDRTYYVCEQTGVNMYIGDVHPRNLPMTCPVCGADATRDDVESCTDAHGDEGGGQDGSDATHDEQDAQDDEATQATLSGFNGGEN